jgi:tetratricopeptide (TPR) repeat protein
MFLLLLVFALASLGNRSFAQCENWNNSPEKEQAENAHTNYRSALKMNDFALAYTEWQKAYQLAPAADGLRDFHYTDGIKIYKQQMKETQDDARKKELVAEILKLYDQVAYCYENGGIKLSNCDDECHKRRAGQLLGRKGFDMFYEFNSPYVENREAFQQSLDKAGNDVEYIIFEPMANIVVYQYQQKKMTAEEVRAIHGRLVEAADYGIANSKDYSQYFESAKARMLAKFAEIESEIFDCEYFKSKLEPMYNEKPDDPDVVKYVYNKLIQEGCSKEDAFLQKLQSTYETYAAEENARLQAEFEANNPGVLANRMYKEGDFENAAVKYREALESEEDPDKRAQYYFNIASIEFRKLHKWQEARANALRAAELRPNWGQPYMLIGDIYAQAAKSCGGDAWGQRIVILAALDKYIYARSIDSSVAEDADRKIAIYNGNRPSKDDAFMRGHKEGDVLSTGCWIGEQTKLRVQ